MHFARQACIALAHQAPLHRLGWHVQLATQTQGQLRVLHGNLIREPTPQNSIDPAATLPL